MFRVLPESLHAQLADWHAHWCSALFQAFVLPIKTAWRYNPEQTPATVDNTTLVLLVKGAILGFVQVILQRHRSDAGPAAAAIALLAAWEMVGGSHSWLSVADRRPEIWQ